MQYFKKIDKDKPQVHLFGCNFSHQTHRQTFFHHHSPSPRADLDQNLRKLEEENERLKQQLSEVRKILSTILYTKPQAEAESKGIMELLEDLLVMILAKAEQNAFLKQQLEEINVETVHKIESRLSLLDSQQQSVQSSQKNIYTAMQQDHPDVPAESRYQTEQVRREGEVKTKYWPKVLFSIGKEVKTIDQISSNKLVKKESLHSYSKSSSQENSLKDLMHLKKNRLSIDKSIYIQTDRDCDPRFSVQNSNRGLQSEEIVTKHNLVTGNQLTPIKQERFSDKFSEMDCSKIKAVGVNFANGERFTFESTNTDPSSYHSRHC